jgi:enamine deaminase RidA (YjgF/YER057c/UK114 family)
LVGTFTRKHQVEETLENIKENFSILNNKVFHFKSFDTREDAILSYNIVLDSYKKFLPNSIMVHQKRETNTIYTINALNELIMNLNNGILDKKYPIEWERYKNCALLKNKEGFKVVKIFLIKVYSW